MSDIQQNSTPQYARVWADGFLVALALYGNVTEAAQIVGIERTTAYAYRNEDKAFASAWEDALQAYSDTLEAEARRRAIEGVDEPVFYRDQIVGHVRKYSDSLLQTLLKANKPEKYRERISQEITGKDGNAIEVKGIDIRAAIAPLAPGSMGDSEPSGASQGDRNGATLGQDDDV